VVRITVGKAVIEMPLSEAYIRLLSAGHLPSPDAANEDRGDFKVRW
jgi:hypothetical protein